MSEQKLPWDKPEQLIGAWTPTTYSEPQPPYVNATQVGSMVRVTVRGDDDKVAIFTVNKFWLTALSEMLADASKKFELGFEDRIYEEVTGKQRLTP